MIDKKIKNLIFDFGNVLVELDKIALIHHSEILGINIKPFIDNSYKSGFFESFEKGLITPKEFRNNIRNLTEKSISDIEIDNAWNSFLTSVPTNRLDLLLKLKQKYKIYLLSNTNSIHWEWSLKHFFTYKELLITDFFDKTYLSYKLKMLKPDLEIYKTVLDDAQINARETLFIDDSPMNCKAAQNLGFLTFEALPDTDWCELFNK